MRPLLGYLKAIVAGVGTFAGGMAVGYVDGDLAPGELWSAIAATAATVGGVIGVPNVGYVRAGRHKAP